VKTLTASLVCFVCNPPWAQEHAETNYQECGESRSLEFGTTCTTESPTTPFKFLPFGTAAAIWGQASKRGAAEHGLLRNSPSVRPSPVEG
jgi:hypothetical protein